ncbi:hypothetical protein [Streptomyces scopuliridis]|uniref:hypothetical protein n=1 Tax=Streptomyces scopuliridis TaxID=452529 RepID=UPI00368D9DAE
MSDVNEIPQATQELRSYGIPPSVAQPLRKHALRKGARGGDGRDRLRWLEHHRAAQGPGRDDPALCPPTMPGQLALFTPAGNSR